MRWLRWTAIVLARFTVVLGLGTSLVGLLIAVVRLCQPVADIRRATADRIKPSMNYEEVEQIIGAPPGWYDGVGGVRVDETEPDVGERVPTWYGMRGRIILLADGARFAPGKGVRFSLLQFVAERLTRRDQAVGHVSSRERLVAFLVLLFPAIVIMSRWLLRCGRPNAIANRGGLGLVIGLLLGGFAFWSCEFGSIFVLAASIGGALLGLVVVLSRLPWSGVSRLAVSPVSQPS